MECSAPGQSGSDSESDTSTEDDDTDDGIRRSRGRKRRQANGTYVDVKPPTQKHESTRYNGTAANGGGRLHERRIFTRSRSPALKALNIASANAFDVHARVHSPSLHHRSKQASMNAFPLRYLLPDTFYFEIRIPFNAAKWRVSVDIRQFFENALLIGSLTYAAHKMRGQVKAPFSPDMWITTELSLMTTASIIYYLMSRVSWTRIAPIARTTTDSPQSGRPASPRLFDRDRTRQSSGTIVIGPKPGPYGFIWMTVPKNYRDSADDGMLTALVIGPLVAAALLYISLKAAAQTPAATRPPHWLIEPPRVLNDARSALDALVLSRRFLVSLSTFCSTILIVHAAASWLTEARHRRKAPVPEGEVSSVPRKELRRAYLYTLFSFSVTLWILCVRIALQEMKLGVWQNLNYYEVVVSSTFFQFSLYICIRMAHHGFTLGEVGITAFGATVLFMEMLNITIARIWPITTPYIRTSRLPTPLLTFQIALICGPLLVGFLLSPLLYLSRHIAQRPVRRLRYPEQKRQHQRLLAVSFYLGALVIIGALIGLWTRWCLGNRDPWLWVLFWLLDGRRPWSRPALLAYWAALASISVAGWNRQLARSRRYRPRPAGDALHSARDAARDGASAPAAAAAVAVGFEGSDPSAPPTPSESSGPLGLNFPNLPNLRDGTMSTVATELLDRADRRVPLLKLNARRKFFHALAVVMFLPGVAVDPAFLHLAFSAAFALFVFAEYVRYFALYPFGAAVHLFMAEFLDAKDSGTAVLSHFYLLIGCAGSVWFEGPSQMLLYTGILVLGVGDALASIVGKRLGRHRWLAGCPKTVEGSAAFAASIFACACALRACGLTEAFSVSRYGGVAALAAALEAFSVQNDNVVLPVYMWGMLVFAEV